MKNILRNLIVIALFMIFPTIINAAGNITASPSSLTIEVGSTKTFNIIASNTIGDVSISSSNGGIASVSTSYWGTGMVDEGQTKTGSVTVTGVNVGSATITLVLDAATFDSEDLSGQIRTVTVNVVAKQTPSTPSTPSTPVTPSNPNQNQNNNNDNKEEKKEDKSKNNNLKDISIDGYNLTKVDNNNYTLSVSNDVASINIKASAEDSKAKLTGDGKHDIKVGDNNIELTITSESGDVNKINIKVTRKDAFYLDDIDNALKSDNNINININSDSKLSSQDLTKIKNSGKVVNLNYYNDNKELLYSWILDGSKINDFDELLTNVSFKSENEKEIKRLSNYAEGIYVSLSNKSKIPSGTKLRIKVKDKYSDKDKVNVYYYDKDKLTVVKEGIEVKDGYIEFDVKDGSDYFITMSKINNSVKEEKNNNTSIILLVALSIILICIIIAIILFILKNRKQKEKD